MQDFDPIDPKDRANELAQVSAIVKAKAILDPHAELIVQGDVRPSALYAAAAPSDSETASNWSMAAPQHADSVVHQLLRRRRL